MYSLKVLSEDFVVKEISSIETKPSGQYLYFKLSKKNLNTLDAVKAIAQRLHIAEKQIGFAGSKDKKAVTEQVCSVIGVKKERLLALTFKDVAIEFIGYGDQPISLGDLQGNYFEIVVRNLDKKTKIKKLNTFPNYFDEQRFGRNNVEIGQALVKKDFKRVVELVDLPSLQEHLVQQPHDFIGALLLLPLRQLRLYLNAYQSRLWNEVLAEYLRRKGQVLKELSYSQGTFIFTKKSFPRLNIPIIGFGTEVLSADKELGVDKEIKEIIQKIMEKEGISFSDFIIKQIPALTLEGEIRKAFVEVQDLKVGKLEKDELHPGKYKVTLSFTLPKGSYATMAVRGMVGG